MNAVSDSKSHIPKRVSRADPRCNEQVHLRKRLHRNGTSSKVPAGKRSTTTKSNCGRIQHTNECNKTSLEVTTIPTQEPQNIKTRYIFMTVRLADRFVAIDQTGAYQRTFDKGNRYICIFYIYRPTYMKGIKIKSRHPSELLRIYNTVHKCHKKRGFKLTLHRMDSEANTELEHTRLPDFVRKKVHTFQHPTPAKPQHVSAEAVPINYKLKVQTITLADESQPLSKERIKRIQ